MRVLGLLSGTSADGASAALVEITGPPPVPRIRLLFHRTYPYPAALRKRILALPAAGAPALCRADFELGEVFARAALRAVREAGIEPDLVASHGQTVWHDPPVRGRGGATLQIGQPAVIAERTGRPVAADFRTRDVAAGGQGAPLVPFFDGIAFRPARGEGLRCVQNIGGIANVTVVGEEGVRCAFDTGPGNSVIDAAVRRVTRGRRTYDRGGRIAAAGRVDQATVTRLLRDKYFRAPPPKSTGRERFGDELVAALALRGGDLVATLTEYVARAIHDAYRRHVFPLGRVGEVLLSGGGARNPVLRRRLRELFNPMPLRTTDCAGVPGDAREAMAFALLGWARVRGVPGNVPAATGARRAVVLGVLVS